MRYAWTWYCVACRWSTAPSIKCAPFENSWWRFTANHGTGFTDEMRMHIAQHYIWPLRKTWLLGGKTLVGNHRGQTFLVVGLQVCTHLKMDFVPLLFADPLQVIKVSRLTFGNWNLLPLQSCSWHPWTALCSWPWWRVWNLIDCLIASVDRCLFYR